MHLPFVIWLKRELQQQIETRLSCKTNIGIYMLLMDQSHLDSRMYFGIALENKATAGHIMV